MILQNRLIVNTYNRQNEMSSENFKVSDKPLLLDCFCGAGGCTRGYQEAGFYVVGVDIKPQPHYIGDDFIQTDALEALRILIGGGYIVGRTGRKYYLSDFAAIHTSPPCQFGSKLTAMAYRGNHPNLIPATRKLLSQTGKPFVIENVENVRRHLINPILLCGSMFGMDIWRHRYFEIWPYNNFWLVPKCNHSILPVLISGTTRRKGEKRKEYHGDEKREAIGIDWMTIAEMDEAIPPVFTRWVGERLISILELQKA